MEQLRYFLGASCFFRFRFSYVTVHVPVFSACLCWFSGFPWCANHYNSYVSLFVLCTLHIFMVVWFLPINLDSFYGCFIFGTIYSKFSFHSKYAFYIHCKRISHFSFLIGICIKNDTSQNYYINEPKRNENDKKSIQRGLAYKKIDLSKFKLRQSFTMELIEWNSFHIAKILGIFCKLHSSHKF